MNQQPADAIRLNKLLAELLGSSRRHADELIAAGRVTVNGQTARLGQPLNRERDVISVDNQPLSTAKTAFIYLRLHKPVGYICSRRRQGETPTIYELLPEAYHHLKPVGRLDKDSSGLLLLTNDGDYAHRMTHPSFAKTKRYEVSLDQPLAPLHQQMISDHGIRLPDGPSRLTISRLDDGRYEVIMHEGRNRQIRRTFEALGYTVTALHRTHFGPVALEGLAVGSYDRL